MSDGSTDTPPPADSNPVSQAGPLLPREKVRKFPPKPGVYLMKDRLGRVIYVGKAVNLRSRAGSYFLAAAAIDRRTADLIPEIADVDCIETDSEVDAVLLEARLIKDIQPRFNQELKDDKTFPYLQIVTGEEFPRVEFTRKPRTKGVKLYGPFTSAKKLRGTINVLQKIFKFRTCALDIDEDEQKWRWFRPCLLASINQCTAPCNLRISKEDYREEIRKLRLFLDGKKDRLLQELKEEMQLAAQERKFERAARLRDEIKALESMNLRGNLKDHVQPEVFYIDPRKGLRGLKKILQLPKLPRVIEGVDIAHLQGGETVASLVQFIDGLPFKHGYKRYKIRTVEGVDDFASMREVVSRRLRRLSQEGDAFPDLLLIDGGKGQLNAALAAMRAIEVEGPTTISLAKREEEIYVPGADEPLRLGRHSYALRLLQYVRDEAHRFAQSYHHTLRRKSTFGE
ncbi:excinuclease ABC subunit UvrC [Planctomicrobium sp. SH664]|uniref:excinuclease ABC subunit UvrC n=1 Tax=Planctomicrobium sp. SH664 TaxID=3448125 RepID=UPI003F5B1E2F